MTASIFCNYFATKESLIVHVGKPPPRIERIKLQLRIPDGCDLTACDESLKEVE